ncbi:hypothetical protein Pmani_016873 [Petrolisthes manimaculis]|uniref:Uncharacterized protein n=1 Tax=Petrolisthes manimaculis TaxID=1843537 RepID=A0AAE1PNT2_9EUCA|nr:hypothetical protein Pmani_016873 [Petrolisthes manimaculis]
MTSLEPRWRRGKVRPSSAPLKATQYHNPVPVGHTGPQVADSDLSRTRQRVGSTFPLHCQAQAHPVPSFREDVLAPPSLYTVRLRHTLHPPSEPVGLSGPKFPSTDTSRSQSKRAATTITLTCQAQAHPPPQFRTQVRRADTSFPLLCQAQAHPTPSFR